MPETILNEFTVMQNFLIEITPQLKPETIRSFSHLELKQTIVQLRLTAFFRKHYETKLKEHFKTLQNETN